MAAGALAELARRTPTPSTVDDYDGTSPDRRRPPKPSPTMLEHICERIGALLDGDRGPAMTTRTPTPATARPRPRSAAATDAAAAHPPRRPRGAGHRQSATLGTRRGAARPAHRRSRRPRPILRWPPAAARPAFPTGKTFDAWDEALSSIPAPTQTALRTLEWIGRAREPRRLRTGRHRQDIPARSPRPGRRRSRAHTSPGSPSKTLGVLVRRHRADDSVTKAITRILRADLVVVDDIGLLPVGPDAAEGLYRLVDAAYETPQRRGQLEPAPLRVRRDHAQDPGHRHRRPAPAPRPPLPDQRRQRPPRPKPPPARG